MNENDMRKKMEDLEICFQVLNDRINELKLRVYELERVKKEPS